MTTGASIEIKVTDQPVLDVLARASVADGDTVQLMRAFGGYLLTSSQQRFETKSGPGGTAWQRLAPRTARERIRLGYGTANILRRRNRLYESLTYVATATAVEEGTNNPYAAIQNFGGEIHHYARSQRIYQHYNARTDTFDPKPRKRAHSNFARWFEIGEHSVTIPARPYLGIDAADTVELVAIGEDWLAGKLGVSP
jgi:phage virion morphogenesis protein